MNTTTKTTKDEDVIAESCFTTSEAISTTSMTDGELVTEHSHFCKLPLEIIELIGLFLHGPKDTAAFCQAYERVKAIMIDKLRLYNPKIKISSSEVTQLLRKWKMRKFELTKKLTSKQIKDKEREGFYLDPNELFQWFVDCRPAKRKFIYKSRELFQRLLKAQDYDPSAEDNYAIKVASENGYLEIVKALLADERVDPSASNNEAIRKSSENGHLEIVKSLLKHEHLEPSAWNNYAIRMASRNGHLEIVKLLLKVPRVDPAVDAIIWASENGHVDVVNLLLADDGVDPSAKDNEAIKLASKNGRLKVVEILLADKRVDPSANDNYAIKWASKYGHLEIVKLLSADKRVDPSAGGNLAIGWASENGHAKVVKLLLEDERVDPSDEDNWAIKMGSSNGHSEVVKLLLAHQKLGLEEKSIRNIRCRWSSYPEIMKLLLKCESRPKNTVRKRKASHEDHFTKCRQS